ncbi:MAG: UDP-N-acetylmuramoyl-L-alanyl-D-glutamate--2,6-diaminopimelate ligase [Muribaculaceae bacterium]|nr:UDP-N-acetylmuramoyl-L-alanyl-D-glutamate--2,6-diaminopimelate ligase [Muribaculaceae bacterium]
MKKLNDIIKSLKPKEILGNTDIMITDVSCDSRQVIPGAMFIAVRGVAVDAHKFIGQTIEMGAMAIVCEELPSEQVQNVTYVVVDDSTVALALIANEWYDRPSEKLRLVGVTGTNGKTTTATLLYELTRKLGYKAGLLSTVRNMVDNKEYEAKQTTPDHLTLNRLLHDMVEAGCDYAFMEVSSHACSQHRIDGLKFAGAIFTNLTRDHLDYHKTVDNYIAAKKMFFDALPDDAFALVNSDDKVGDVMLQNTRASKYHYSLRSLADFNCKVLEDRLDGMTLLLNGTELEVQFVGRFNAYNLTCVYGAAILLGLHPDEILVKMSQLEPVAGRFQTIRSRHGYTAIVDYAHTPDALVNVLNTINEVINGKGRVITVCGCGGDRDAGKRPIMAREAAIRSDQVILTSDNPRSEDPELILLDMEKGLDDKLRRKALKVSDRRDAIRLACQLAQPGDVVLVAGKGHEPYQEIKGVRHHFDDREEILALEK